MKAILKILILFFTIAHPLFVRGIVLSDETVNGAFSFDPGNPTLLGGIVSRRQYGVWDN